jgi:hypothetical protein
MRSEAKKILTALGRDAEFAFFFEVRLKLKQMMGSLVSFTSSDPRMLGEFMPRAQEEALE